MPRVRYKHNPQPTRDEMKIMIKQQLLQVTMLLNQLGEAYRHINDLEELLQKKKKKEEDEVSTQPSLLQLEIKCKRREEKEGNFRFSAQRRRRGERHLDRGESVLLVK